MAFKRTHERFPLSKDVNRCYTHKYESGPIKKGIPLEMILEPMILSKIFLKLKKKQWVSWNVEFLENWSIFAGELIFCRANFFIIYIHPYVCSRENTIFKNDYDWHQKTLKKTPWFEKSAILVNFWADLALAYQRKILNLSFGYGLLLALWKLFRVLGQHRYLFLENVAFLNACKRSFARIRKEKKIVIFGFGGHDSEKLASLPVE